MCNITENILEKIWDKPEDIWNFRQKKKKKDQNEKNLSFSPFCFIYQIFAKKKFSNFHENLLMLLMFVCCVLYSQKKNVVYIVDNKVKKEVID